TSVTSGAPIRPPCSTPSASTGSTSTGASGTRSCRNSA
ncbi:MAG: hypothetical protein AMXMBFR42_20880, partial [Burkholderiales bacterium]